jgi:hypothetical protein
MMRLVLAPKSTKKSKKNSSKLEIKNQPKKSPKIMKLKTVQLIGRQDSIQKHSYIEANQMFTRCGSRPNILPLFGRLERISHSLFSLLLDMKHTHTTQKAKSKPRCGGGMTEILTFPLALGSYL